MKRLFDEIGYVTILLFCNDAVFIFLAWIIRPDALASVSLFIILFSLLSLAVSMLFEYRRKRRISAAIEALLESPDKSNKAILLASAGSGFKESIELLYNILTENKAKLNEKQTELLAYQEYIEEWVHEIKTPLSLSTMVLNNRKEEMSPYVYNRMIHVQNRMNDDVEKILYYARLQAEHTEYKFVPFRLDECVKEVVSEYENFASENRIDVRTELNPVTVISDRKVIRFMISQLISNAYKYADSKNGSAHISVWQDGDSVYLTIYNNGKGVPAEDAPFIFDKGFTGNYPDRQKATGIGLYLVKKYADKLCVKIVLDPISVTGNGFKIELIFKL